MTTADPHAPYPVHPDLAGKVAVVTGGSRGIGAATARALAAQGVAVCLVGRDRQALFSVAESIGKQGGTAIGAVADVTDAAALRRVADRVAGELGPVDVLAAFAGGHPAPLAAPELSEERWRRILDSELTATFLTVHTFLPGMLDRLSGSILTLSSAGRAGTGNLAHAVADAGVTALTRRLATELGPHGIRVNCLAPAAVRTGRTTGTVSKEDQHRLALRTPLRRLGEPSDVASAALFLASDAASYLTGVTLEVAGGRVSTRPA